MKSHIHARDRVPNTARKFGGGHTSNYTTPASPFPDA